MPVVMHKFPLQTGKNIVTAGSRICAPNCHVAVQAQELQLWAQVEIPKGADPLHSNAVDNEVYVALTGEALPYASERCQLISTVLMNGGGFVVHAFLIHEA